MDNATGANEMSGYQIWIEKRAANLAEFMKANDMTTTMLIEAVVELCAQQGIDAGDRVEAEMTYAEWRKEVA
jgi:hypothetical protein